MRGLRKSFTTNDKQRWMEDEIKSPETSFIIFLFFSFYFCLKQKIQIKDKSQNAKTLTAGFVCIYNVTYSEACFSSKRWRIRAKQLSWFGLLIMRSFSDGVDITHPDVCVV